MLYEDDYDYSPADSGWVHEDDLPDLASVKEFLMGVIEAVYETGDIEDLHFCLEEACGYLDMKVPAKNPVLWRRIA